MSADVARRVSLGAQGFADKRPSGNVDRRHLRRVMRRLNVIQLDSIPIIIRTQHLPFHSRLGPYRPELVDDLAYARDEWFEAWAHEASLLPVESEPLFRWTRDRARDGQTWKSLSEVARREPGYVQSVLDEVRERGALAGGELSDPRPLPGDGSGWWHRSLGVLALDWLFRVGELGVRRRGNFEKVFSPIEDIIPAEILAAPTPSVDEAQRALCLQAVQALGVGTDKEIADWFRLSVKELRPRLAELAEAGSIVPAAVKGWGTSAWADPAAPTPRKIQGATVLSPFDPVVWNRDRALRMFDFDYRIEIYVPEAKRRWGYYVLPIMVDGQIVARSCIKTDRDAGVLRIRTSWAEDGHADAETAERVAPAFHDLAKLVGVDEIEIQPVGDLAPHLSPLF